MLELRGFVARHGAAYLKNHEKYASTARGIPGESIDSHWPFLADSSDRYGTLILNNEKILPMDAILGVGESRAIHSLSSDLEFWTLRIGALCKFPTLFGSSRRVWPFRGRYVSIPDDEPNDPWVVS